MEDIAEEILQVLVGKAVSNDDQMCKILRDSVKTALGKSPTSKMLVQIVSCMCGAELVADAANPKFSEKASKFYSYCSSDLGLVKRDLPKALVDKIDKAVKARFHSNNATYVFMHPDIEIYLYKYIIFL